MDAEKERKGKARTVGKTLRIRKGKVGKQGGQKTVMREWATSEDE